MRHRMSTIFYQESIGGMTYFRGSNPPRLIAVGRLTLVYKQRWKLELFSCQK